MATPAQITGTWILVILYMAGIVYFVIRGALKTRNVADYAVGSIRFSPIAVGLSLAAGMTSAATFVINPGFIANYGLSAFISYALIFPAGALLSLIILTRSFRKYGQSVQALTLAQWIGKRYQSQGYALLMAFLSLLLITFIVLILVAITKVLAGSLAVNQHTVLLVLIVFVFGYMMFGGANSMVYTNTIQAGVMIAVALILLSSGYAFFSDGIGGFLNQLRAIDARLTRPVFPESPLFRDYYEIIFAQLVVGIAVVVQPHIITRSLLLKHDKDVGRFLWIATLVQGLFFLVVFTGFYARLTFPDLKLNGEPLPNDNIIPAYVVVRFSASKLGILIGLLVVFGLISAGLSTLEGLIQSLSSTITNDIVKPISGNRLQSEKTLLLVNRLAIGLLAVVAYFLAAQQLVSPRLSVAILAQNGVYAYFSAAFIPVIFGMFLRSKDFRPPLVATITAIVTHFGIYYLLPYLVQYYDVDLGFFTSYLQGTVRNPAIAASAAIVFSTLSGLLTYWIIQKFRIHDQRI